MTQLRELSVQDGETLTIKHDFPIISCFKQLKDSKAMLLLLCRLSRSFHTGVESSDLTPHSAFNWHPICIVENSEVGTGRCVCGG